MSDIRQNDRQTETRDCDQQLVDTQLLLLLSHTHISPTIMQILPVVWFLFLLRIVIYTNHTSISSTYAFTIVQNNMDVPSTAPPLSSAPVQQSMQGIIFELDGTL
jgi:hypothetical protein